MKKDEALEWLKKFIQEIDSQDNWATAKPQIEFKPSSIGILLDI